MGIGSPRCRRLTPSSRTRPSWRRPPRFCPSRREEDRWSSRSAGASREGYPPGFSRCKVGLCLVASFFCAWLGDTEFSFLIGHATPCRGCALKRTSRFVCLRLVQPVAGVVSPRRQKRTVEFPSQLALGAS